MFRFAVTCFLALCILTAPCAADLPASFDLRDQHAVTAAKSQGDTNTCWAFGVVNAAESNIILKGLADADSIDLSELQLAYFTYSRDAVSIDSVLPGLEGLRGDHVSLTNGSYLDAGGNELFAVFALAAWFGFANESAAPYADVQALDASLAYAADSYHLTDSLWLTFEDPQHIKQMIIQTGAASIGLYVNTSSYRNETFAYYCRDHTTSSHTVGLIGWDDNFSTDNFAEKPPGNGAWLVKNSWGTEFGDSGFFWVSYYDTSLDNAVFFDTVPAATFDHNYQYDGGILPTSMPIDPGHTDDEITVSAANVFTAKGSEYIRAVSFFTFNKNVSSTICVSTDGVQPGSALRRVQTGNAEFPGYHTVELERPLLLRPGEKFAVTVTLNASSDTSDFFKNPGLSLPLDLTQRHQAFTSTSVSEKDQTYLFDENKRVWTDIGANGDVNARIKAFTTDAFVALDSAGRTAAASEQPLSQLSGL